MKTRTLLLAGVAIIGVGSLATAEAALISTTLDTFTGGGAVPSGYSASNANGEISLEVDGVGTGKPDGSELDGVSDGYLAVNKTAMDNQTVGLRRSLGTVSAADIGSTITVDIAFFKAGGQGFNSTHRIELDGTSVGGAGEGVINTFGARPGDGLLSDFDVNGAPLTYTIAPGDVGAAVTYLGTYFDNTSGANNQPVNAGRDFGFDAVSISVVPIPEPSAGLLAIGLLLFGRSCGARRPLTAC